MSLLSARGVGRRQASDQPWLLDDVSLEISRGGRRTIVGPTGAGKTLLLRALACLDPLDRGEILWRGDAVRGRDVPRFRRQVIYLHQRPALIEGTVEENLRLPFSFRSGLARGHTQFDLGAALSLLERANRTRDFLDRLTRDLSGGESQIVALVRAVQLDPVVLLLDEPTASLDGETAGLLESLVMSWYDAAPGERAFVWVSHDAEQVARIGAETLTMRAGRIVAGGDQRAEDRT